MKRAYLIILGSFGYLIGGAILISIIDSFVKSEAFMDVAMPISLFGFAGLFLWGTGTWAAAKGYSMLLGIILGWLLPIGLLILVLLPDRSVPDHTPDSR
ncbi:MAG TPA: hypothetical protein VM452_12605 [Caulifigura sp.]|jgi:hypothetical protein|nr:hypothetical protein [Caulifigura sp.]